MFRTFKGTVGICCEMVWLEPKDANSQADIAASQRCFLCTFARYTQPIFGNGDYPDVLKSQMAKLCQSLGLPLSVVLPSFTPEEIEENKGVHSSYCTIRNCISFQLVAYHYVLTMKLVACAKVLCVVKLNFQ